MIGTKRNRLRFLRLRRFRVGWLRLSRFRLRWFGVDWFGIRRFRVGWLRFRGLRFRGFWFRRFGVLRFGHNRIFRSGCRLLRFLFCQYLCPCVQYAGCVGPNRHRCGQHGQKHHTCQQGSCYTFFPVHKTSSLLWVSYVLLYPAAIFLSTNCNIFDKKYPPTGAIIRQIL